MSKKLQPRLVICFLLILLPLLLLGCGGGTGGYGAPGHVVPYQDKHFTVEPLQEMTMTINMNHGALFEGYLTVRGGNDDVRFYIKDSYGNKVLDINRVRGRYDFDYHATSEGFHTIYFDNSFSLVTSKQVYIHFRVR